MGYATGTFAPPMNSGGTPNSPIMRNRMQDMRNGVGGAFNQTNGGYNEPVTGVDSPFPTVGVSPESQYGAAADLEKQRRAQEAQSALSKQNFDQSQEAQQNLINRLPGVMHSGGGQGDVTYGGGTPTNPETFQKAQEAAFARAKDRAGLISKSAITGLRDNMAARGTLGSGMEGEQTANILSGAAGGLGDVNREQMIKEANSAQHIADQEYQGGITQRGQNIQAMQGLLAALRSGGSIY